MPVSSCRCVFLAVMSVTSVMSENNVGLLSSYFAHDARSQEPKSKTG